MVLYSYQGTTDGSTPVAIDLDPSGNILAAASAGGANGRGTLYRISPAGSASLLYAFGATGDGTNPNSILTDCGGNIYGTTDAGGTVAGGGQGYGTIFKLASNASTSQVLYTFTNGTDGSAPSPGMIVDAHGNLFGTAYQGGGGSGVTNGTVYELSARSGALTVLHKFAGGTSDGSGPNANLVMDPAGNLYGSTISGGSTGNGVVFEIEMPSGQETILYNFPGGPSGEQPGQMLMDTQGNLYGVANGGNSFVDGVIFKIPAGTGTEQVVYAFKGGSDGATPASLVMDAHGNLFGTTMYGGTGCSSTSGCGTIFEIPAGTTTEQQLYAFQGGTDGAHPARLTIDTSGNLYGTTIQGGSANQGTVFAYYK